MNYDYVTLFDVYECAINPDKLEMKIKEGERLFQTQEYVLVSDVEYMARRDLSKYEFGRDPATGEVKAAISVELLRYLDQNHIGYSIVTETGGDGGSVTPENSRKREQLDAVKRWFYHDWRRIEPKLRTSIVEGISVFLSLFDDNPSVKATFCPPKECYDAELNHDGRYGIPMPPFPQLLEQGKVCALNFPVAMNPGLARTIGTLMKQDFQRAVLNRIPLMELEPARHWREILFLCDEYQSFATVGESDPTGDEKFFALSRQAKCIMKGAIVAVASHTPNFVAPLKNGLRPLIAGSKSALQRDLRSARRAASGGYWWGVPEGEPDGTSPLHARRWALFAQRTMAG